MDSLVYVDGKWHEGNPPLMGAGSLATWLGGVIFDGARAFDGVTPDLDLHCQRACRSAEKMNMRSPMKWEEMQELVLEGVSKFPSGSELYLKPLIWAEDGWIFPDPDTSRIALHIFQSDLPDPATGFSATFSTFRRPAPDQAPTDAKAACLYPNQGRALKEAVDQGFGNAIVLDPVGNVAEFATANLFMAKDGIVKTPTPNGTFLNGITRQRVIKLLHDSGQQVEECAVSPQDVRDADEVWSTGNHAKVMPVNKVGDRDLQPGPLYQKARDLYWEFAHSTAK